MPPPESPATFSTTVDVAIVRVSVQMPPPSPGLSLPDTVAASMVKAMVEEMPPPSAPAWLPSTTTPITVAGRLKAKAPPLPVASLPVAEPPVMLVMGAPLRTAPPSPPVTLPSKVVSVNVTGLLTAAWTALPVLAENTASVMSRLPEGWMTATPPPVVAVLAENVPPVMVRLPLPTKTPPPRPGDLDRDQGEGAPRRRR
ncbi:hypothetical protein BH24ACT7_BH24ACT7_26420 [soil metagenome]